MKILFFSHQAEFIYGGEICTLELMRGLGGRGIQVYFASPSGPYQDRAKEYASVFSVLSVQFSRKVSDLPKLIFALKRSRSALRKIIREEKIDIVHATSLKAMVYARTCGAPVVWHHHDILPEKFANRLWLQWIARTAVHILTPSRAGAEALVRSGVEPKKITVLYNGFAVDRWHPRRAELSGEIFRVAVVGEISRRKGSDWIRPIADGLKGRGIPFEIHVVGVGLSEPTFAEAVKKENASFVKAGMVHFHGRREDIPKFLQGIDLLLVPSRQDPLPTVIVEALLTGVPVVGTPVGGIPEMIIDGENGFLAKSPEEIIEKILRAARRDLYPRLSRSARRVAEEKFSLDRMVESVIHVYKDTRGGINE